MEDVIAILVDEAGKHRRAFMTWGRVFDPIGPTSLIDGLRKGLAKFGVSKTADIIVLQSLKDASSAEYFYEGLLHFAWKPIPFGKKTYPPWARKMRSAIGCGKEIVAIGTISSRKRVISGPPF